MDFTVALTIERPLPEVFGFQLSKLKTLLETGSVVLQDGRAVRR